jgi:hypothetical protein
MDCARECCHCQSEVAIERQGQQYCSEHCAGAEPRADDACGCGHAGCSVGDEKAAAW